MKKLSGVFVLFVCVIFGVKAYDVLLFGDTHYDSAEVRTPDQELSENRRKEFARNIANWEANIPAMLDAAAARTTRSTAFAVQLGDLIQGDCGSWEMHRKSLEQALSQFHKRLSIPFYPVKGNHDIRDKDGKAAYNETMLPYVGKLLNLDAPLRDKTNYAVLHERDLYIFFDCMEPDLAFVKEELAANPDARYVFFLTHYPVLPCVQTEGAGEVVFGRPDRERERLELRKILAERNAIVFCAHTHRTNLVRYEDENGTITQFTCFSILSQPQAPFAQERMANAGEFFNTPDLDKILAGNKNLADLVNGYKGRYREFISYRPGAGFYILKPTDSGVSIEIYFGTAAKPADTVKLR